MAHEISGDALLRIALAPNEFVRVLEIRQAELARPCDCIVETHDPVLHQGTPHMQCRACGRLTPWRRPSRIARLRAWLMEPIISGFSETNCAPARPIIPPPLSPRE